VRTPPSPGKGQPRSCVVWGFDPFKLVNGFVHNQASQRGSTIIKNRGFFNIKNTRAVADRVQGEPVQEEQAGGDAAAHRVPEGQEQGGREDCPRGQTPPAGQII